MRILLAIDGSEASQAAANEVAVRPWPPNTSVDVVTVVEPAHLWSTSEGAVPVYTRAVDLLVGTLDNLRSAGLEADGNVLRGDPKAAILARAAEYPPDWIVLGSHAVSGVAHLFLGNVASNVLRHAPCSVLIARPKPEAAKGPRVLIATDGSSFSEAAVRSVAARQWPEGTEFRVFTVVELTLTTIQALFEPPFMESEQLQAIRVHAMEHAQAAADTAIQLLQSHLPHVSEYISVLTDGPKALILQESKEWDADLIVLGSHGRTGASRFLLGSVSEGVATHAHCSVEVIRQA